MLVTGAELLADAATKQKAVGAFNTYNLETTRAIIGAAESCQCSVMLALGCGALRYAGFELLSALALEAAHQATVPVAVHLDHGEDKMWVQRAIQAGYTSVMIDGSLLSLADNIALTREGVQISGEMAVEGELGGYFGDEDDASHQMASQQLANEQVTDHSQQITTPQMTDVAEAQQFVAETGVSALAVAIGNAHGLYKGKPQLNFERLAALNQNISIPLVLHGASGLSDADLTRAIGLGIRKINVNTEIRQALFHTLGQCLNECLNEQMQGYNLPKVFGQAIEAMQAQIVSKLKLFSGMQ